MITPEQDRWFSKGYDKGIEDYKNIMGLNTQDIGSVKMLRAFVNKLLEEKGYKKIKGYKSMKELIAIKLNLLTGKQNKC